MLFVDITAFSVGEPIAYTLSDDSLRLIADKICSFSIRVRLM